MESGSSSQVLDDDRVVIGVAVSVVSNGDTFSSRSKETPIVGGVGLINNLIVPSEILII